MAIADANNASVEYGLDALDLPASAGREPLSRRLVRVVVPKLVAIGLLLGAWELAADVFGLRSDNFPSPADVWNSLSDQWSQGNVITAVLTSLLHAGEGYAIAIAIGTSLGLVIARVRVVRYAIGSIIAALLSLPSVVWAIPAVIWFKINPAMMIFVVVMGAFPSITSGTVAAVDQIPPLLLRVGDAMGARGFARYRHIILPAALPGYVAGMKQGWAFSWRSLMAAEIIVQSTSLGLGLGQLLDDGRSNDEMPLVFVSIVLILVVGVLVDSLVFTPLDRAIRSRRGLVAS
jgi:NitT/TauT family transport system permease protein